MLFKNLKNIEEYINLGDIQTDIEYLEDNVPSKKEKEKFKEWKEEINKRIKLYNKLAKFKAYHER